MLSACAGRHGPEAVAIDRETRGGANPASYAELVETRTAGVVDPDDYLLKKSELAAAHRADERHYDRERHAHYHEEPSPEEKAFAEGVLLMTGAVFVCTFVVVVLDGACSIGAHAGYYY
ncbi:MAG: hypothetical protein AAGA21_14780 [Pseudomonadota bacterium]